MDPQLLIEGVRRGVISPEEAAGMAAPSTWDTLKSMGKYAADVAGGASTGALRTVSGFAGMPADISNLLSRGIAHVFNKDPGPDLPFGSKDIEEAAGKAASNLPGWTGMYKPETQAGEYASAGTEGALSMLSGRALLKALGVGSGMIGELAEKSLPEVPGARLAGTAGTLALGGPLAFRKPRMINSVQESLKDPGVDLKAMGDAANKATDALGTPVSISHFGDQSGSIAALAQEIASNPYGGILRDAMVKERQAAGAASKDLVQSQTSLPVSTATQKAVSDAGSRVDQIATDARKRAVGPLYDASEVDKLKISDISDALLAESQKKNWAGGPRAVPLDSASNYLPDMSKAQGLSPKGTPAGVILGPNGLPLTPAGAAPPATLSAKAVGDLANAMSATGRGPVTADKLPYDRAAGILSDAARAGSPAQAQADNLYQQISKARVDPLREGPVGQSFPPIPEGSPNIRDWSTMTRIVSDPLSHPSDINMLAQELRSANPTAFPLLVKRSFMEAAQQSSPVTFIKKVAGDPTAVDFQNVREGFKAKVYNAQLANGLTAGQAQEAAAGAERVADAITAVGTGQQAMPGRVRVDIAEKAGENLASDLIKVAHPHSLLFRWTMIDKLSNFGRRQVMEDVSNAFLSRDAAARLREIASYSSGENALKVLMRFGGSVADQNANR